MARDPWYGRVSAVEPFDLTNNQEEVLRALYRGGATDEKQGILAVDLVKHLSKSQRSESHAPASAVRRTAPVLSSLWERGLVEKRESFINGPKLYRWWITEDGLCNEALAGLR